jgi:hypothetical protein
MASVARGSCRAVAPLIARYNDPELGESERVLLSTHLLQCESCLARLQEYRQHDQLVRRMAGTTLSPEAREAVLERVAAPAGGFGLPGAVVVWRQAWVGAAMAASLTALIFAFGIASFGAAQQDAGASPGPSTTANEAIVRPLTTTILGANPTQVTQAVNAVGESFSGTMGVYQLHSGNVSTVRATVREVNAREGRLVVLVDGARGEEGLVVSNATLVLRADGRQATLGDIAAGVIVHVERDENAAGSPVARIILSR